MKNLALLVAAVSSFGFPILTRAAMPESGNAAVVLPADDARHPGRENLPEWWYYNGHLTSASGRKFGYELVFFQYRLWSIPVRAVQFAVTDIHGQKFDSHTWIFPGHYSTVKNGFDLGVPGGPKARGGDGVDHLHARLPGGAELTLDLRALKRAIPEMGDGLITVADPETGEELAHEHYYSRTRISAVGTLKQGGQVETVTGESWFDHEWGKLARVGWNWFSIQLDNHQEIMAYDVFQKAGGPSAFAGVTMVGSCAECSNLVLGPREFSIFLGGGWKSPHSGKTYPTQFSLEVPSIRLKLALTPLLADQEVKSRYLPTYWEGAVSVSGLELGAPVSGEGYVELTGY